MLRTNIAVFEAANTLEGIMAHGHISFAALAPRSKLYQGPFGRICSDLDPWIPEVDNVDQFFLDIANNRMIELPGSSPSEIAKDPAILDELESQFGSNIPAGYTYFGQFIDHDITFDPTSQLMRQNDPNALLNFRTPRLDLDSVYGRGPADQPYLYEGPNDRAKFVYSKVCGTSLPDLPRIGGVAVIGDKRNDENSIVSQLQLAFLLAHNELVDRAVGQRIKHPFIAAQRTLRWLYQFVVWNDFVRRIAIDDVYQCALALGGLCGGRKGWTLGLKDVYNWKQSPFMPIEFSVAAYRFGHSMVRNSYQTNNPHRGFRSFAPIFDNTGATDPDDLRGFRPVKKENVIQWDWFLPMTSSSDPFPQRARKIDTKLSNALAALHEENAGSPLNVLAFRNLKRGLSFGLPAGTAVARKYCLKEVSLTSAEPDSLWFYILKEAELLPGSNSGQMLGRLGSTLVCAVFSGLLKGDPCSYINQAPCWSPASDPLLRDGEDNIDDGAWTLASIIRLSGLPVDSDDVASQT